MDINGVIRTYVKNTGNKGFVRRMNYQKAYESVKTKGNVVFYESFFGKNITDNPLALFEYLFEQDKEKKLTHIWAFNPDEDNGYYQYYKQFKNVKFVQPHTKKYFTALCQAKYLVTNVSMPFYFVKKDDQIIIDTWHGTPLKAIGRETAGSITQNFNVTRSFLASDFLLSPNPFTTDKLVYSYDIDGIYKGRVLESGYPRIDVLKGNSDPKVVKDSLTSLNIDRNKKIVLYAPTWRGGMGAAENNIDSLIELVQDMADKMDLAKYQLLVKVHPLAARYLTDVSIDGVVFVPTWLDANQLLYYSDILITDYSSIFFDYLVLDRPIIFFQYDRESYLDDRGAYLDFDRLPGATCQTTTEVIDLINNSDNIMGQHTEVINEFKDMYTPYEDGAVCERVVNRVFHSHKNEVRELTFDNGKKNVVIHAGAFRNNGVTSSLLNLTSFFDYENYNLIVIDKSAADETFNRYASKVDKRAHLLFRGYPFNLTYSEWISYQNILYKGEIGNEEKHRQLVTEEWRRLLGDTPIYTAIEFSGYSPIWCYMMAFAPADKKYIYLHNDMMAEATKVVRGKKIHEQKFSVVFKLYKYFDKLCTVGQQTLDLNKQKLGEYTRPDQFTYIPNTIDANSLFEFKENPRTDLVSFKDEKYISIDTNSGFGKVTTTLLSAPTDEGVNFVNIGRLSPEKGQDRLLEAFKILQNESNDKHKLYILGDGADDALLKSLAESLHIKNSVVFAGFTTAGTELLYNLDCLVQPSRHEGQPMVLLEALAMEKPIVATDIAGNKSALDGTGVKLYDDSVQGIYEGMRDFVNGKVKSVKFDVDGYNNAAMKRFSVLL